MDAPTKPRRLEKKHALGSLKQLSYCPASLLMKGVATKVPTKVSSATSASQLRFHNIAVARFVVRLAMSLASKKIGGFGKDVLSMTVALGEAECCIFRLLEGQSLPNFENQKLDQRVGSEWFTQDRDAGSANDHTHGSRDNWEQSDMLARET